MKRSVLLSIAALIFISQAALSIPMGGPGSRTRDMIKGTFIVEGTIEVNGLFKMNGQKYVWPKVQAKAGQQLVIGEKGALAWQDEIGPGGTDGSVQLNSAGDFSGSSDLLWENGKKILLVGGTPVSLSGHNHSAADINKGALAVANGGTGTDNGSVNGAGELKLNAGGVNQNVVVTPSGSGAAIVNGAGLVSMGPVRSEIGFNLKGTDGASGTVNVISDLRLNGTVIQKKMRSITVTGGIITAISADSDWMDVK